MKYITNFEGTIQPGSDLFNELYQRDVNRLEREREILGNQTEGTTREGTPLFEELRRMDLWRYKTEQKLFGSEK